MRALRVGAAPKLVALDLDGTLVGEDLTIRPRVRDAIARMQACGVQGCIVTGRMFRSALPYARRLGFDLPLVCYQGAAVIEPSGELLFEAPLPAAQALRVVAYAQANALHVQLYADDTFYVESLNEWARLYADISGVEPVVIPSLREYFAGRDATKALIVADALAAAEHAERVRALFAQEAYVTRSIAQFIEIMNPRVDKGRALRVVAQRLGIGMESVLAVGDSWNDAPLLRAAGFGVAMGSAPAELRALADAVVADVRGDGVAEAIERYVLA